MALTLPPPLSALLFHTGSLAKLELTVLDRPASLSPDPPTPTPLCVDTCTANAKLFCKSPQLLSWGLLHVPLKFLFSYKNVCKSIFLSVHSLSYCLLTPPNNPTKQVPRGNLINSRSLLWKSAVLRDSKLCALSTWPVLSRALSAFLSPARVCSSLTGTKQNLHLL